MNKHYTILTVASLALLLTAFRVISAEENPPTGESMEEVKSVAYYVANVKEARAKNQQCFDNPAIKASEDCENALHALQISFKGGN